MERDNSGALFKNDKGDNPKRPDYRGDAVVDGITYEIAAWVKEGRKGKFMSLSFKVKAGDAAEPTAKKRPPADLDDEIPF